MIAKEINTGMTLNRILFSSDFRGPKQLVASKNSAFSIHRKRTRDELPEEAASYKRFKICEDPTMTWDVSITSKSSNSSHSGRVKEDTNVVITPPTVEEEGKEDKEVILRTRTLQFTPYQELYIKARQEFYSQTLENIGNQCVRGRKRTNVVSKAPTLLRLVDDIVMPEWEAYLVEKRDKENSNKSFGLRSDAVWKKLFRDCREFFRILFKHRFHRMDYQSCDDKLTWIKVLTKELGFPGFEEDNLIYFFQFFHQIHLSEKNKAKYKEILTENPIGVEALNRYTNQSRTLFLEDPMCSRLLYFVYRNFEDFYSKLLSKNIKPKVQEWIEYFLGQYDSLKAGDDVISTKSLPI